MLEGVAKRVHIECLPARQVGIIHTSYRELSKRNAGLVMAGVSALLNSWLCAIHCHKVRCHALRRCSLVHTDHCKPQLQFRRRLAGLSNH